MNHPQENNLVLIEFGGDGAIQASEDDTARSHVEATDVSADSDPDMVNQFTTETDENIYWAQRRDIGELVTENDELVKENDELVKENDELVKENDELVKANDKQAQYIQQLVKDHEALGQTHTLRTKLNAKNRQAFRSTHRNFAQIRPHGHHDVWRSD